MNADSEKIRAVLRVAGTELMKKQNVVAIGIELVGRIALALLLL